MRHPHQKKPSNSVKTGPTPAIQTIVKFKTVSTLRHLYSDFDY